MLHALGFRVSGLAFVASLQIKEQELEAAAGLLPDSLSLRLPPFPQGAPQGAPVGFYLRMPIDPPTASSIENCLKASLGVEQLPGAPQGAPPWGPSPPVLHILSPPGAPYPLEAPVVWVSSGAPPGAPSNEEGPPPYGEEVGAILCGAFAAHNAVRLSRPLQQLSEGISSSGGPSGGPSGAPKILSVLSSFICETSVTDITALLQAAWQLEALLDELLAKDPEGPRGMRSRWLAAAAGGPPPPNLPATATAATAAAMETATAVSVALQEEKGAPVSPVSGGAPQRGRETPRGRVAYGGAPSRGKGPFGGPHGGGGGTSVSAGDLQLCKDILGSIKHPASSEAMSLPVRQHYDSIRDFLTDPERQVLVVQGETG